MALINCTDCGKLVSKQAFFCTCCGLPLKSFQNLAINNIIESNKHENVKPEKKEIPIWEKQNLTLEEAAEYSNIGINRLTMLIKNPKCRFVLNVGTKRLIKRKQFDEFIDSVDYI